MTEHFKFLKKKCDTCGIEPTGAALEAQKNHPKILNQLLILIHHISEFGYPEIITFTNVFCPLKT